MPTRGAWALMLPMGLWLALFVVAPGLIMLVYSFCQRDDLGQVVFRFTDDAGRVTLFDNYRRILNPNYLKILWQSIWYAGFTTFICAVIGYPVAYCIATASERSRNLLLMGVMIPFWTSFLIRTYAWITILKTHGLLNAFLEATRILPVLDALGLSEGPVSLLYTPTAVMIGLVYAYLPFMILPIYGSVEKLDKCTIEAAMDLGAGPIRSFARVILPLTWPGLIAGSLLVFIPAIGMFAIQDLMGGARVPMIGNVIQNQFIKARDWPFGAALGTTLLLLFVITYGLASWKRRVGELRA